MKFPSEVGQVTTWRDEKNGAWFACEYLGEGMTVAETGSTEEAALEALEARRPTWPAMLAERRLSRLGDQEATDWCLRLGRVERAGRECALAGWPSVVGQQAVTYSSEAKTWFAYECLGYRHVAEGSGTTRAEAVSDLESKRSRFPEMVRQHMGIHEAAA